MKKLIAVIVFITSSQFLSAQNFKWAKSFGGTGNDIGYGAALDANGNIYTVGFFRGTVDFDPGPSTFTLNAFGFSDIFISKLDANGNFVWAKQIGGTGWDSGHAITIDNSGNIYISGDFEGIADFDPSSGVFSLTSNGSSDMFVSKYDNLGNFIWAKSAGGQSADEALAISLDNFGNVYTTGSFYDTVDFNPGILIDNLIANINNYQAFILKLDNNGNYVWAKSLSGASSSQAYSIKTDNVGDVYLSGYFSGNLDFDPNAGTFIVNSQSWSYDSFVLKLNSSGSFLWAKDLGGVNFNCASNSITVDLNKNSYITGYYSGTVDFDPTTNIYNLTSNGNYDVYIVKLDAFGNFIWAKSFGGIGDDYGFDIKIDAQKNIYIMGDFRNTVDFDPGVGTKNITSSGDFDVYISKLDSTGNFIFAGNIGGTNLDAGYSLCYDSLENIYVTGYFNGLADYNPGAGNTILTSNGLGDVFVLKINTSKITGLYDFQNKKPIDIIIYPNPNNGTFTITSKEKINLTIINNLGQTIQSLEINENTNFQQNITINTSGIYYISGNTDKKIIKQKIIVTK